MKKIFLIRHAKSSWKDTTCKDLERPLNERGRRNAPMLAKRAAKKWAAPMKIFCSPAKRAVETAEYMKTHWWKNDFCLKTSLYEKSTEFIFELLKENKDEIDSVAYIFHNPSITSLSNLLLGNQVNHIPTCGIIVLGLPKHSWKDITPLSCKLLEFDYPKKVLNSGEIFD